MKIFARFNNLLGFLHGYILNAAARYRLYGMKEAKESMNYALEIGRADNIVLPFAEYSNHIMSILEDLQKDNADDGYLKRVVGYAISYRTNFNNSFKETSPVIPSLTKREKEILCLLVEGKTNREIASELYIAEVTVKKNITSIYRKLNITGRASAVKKTMELKII